VVRESGELVGILTLDDLLGLLAEEMGEVSKLIAREHSRELRARA
ncbi:MAG: CBS domain-containing protein, partial [Acidobacteria bacterium]|nr:CBS domain-containing protein [Acidobacteriota bacterium]